MNTYFLSKLLPTIFSPFGLILLINIIIAKKNKLLYFSLGILIFLGNGIVSNALWWYLEYPWKRIDFSRINSAEAIVVLSGGLHLPPGNSEIVEWNDGDRFNAGVDLFKKGKASKLIFTGGFNPYIADLPLEGDFYKNQALANGLSGKDIIITLPVKNTLEEAKETKKIMDRISSSDDQTIILVTSAFHMERAKKVFENQEIIVNPYPVDFKSINKKNNIYQSPLIWVPNSRDFYLSSAALRELLGRIYYQTWR